jgi:lysozyme
MPNNPPIPAGYKLLPQLAVSADMTAWAVAILKDSATYPMFSTARQAFGDAQVLARVEWHVPDFQNHAVHRGVTLYEPIQVDTTATVPEGIDVSGYQPVVDWAQIAGSGLGFAFIKATEGTTLVDHTFADHWARAKQAGLLRGAYHFFRPQQDALAQAKHFVAQLADRGELPPVLDVEIADGVSPDKIVAGVSTWLDFVTASVRRPTVYTMPGFWNSLPGTANLSDKADLWVAHWGARTPAAVNGWSSWNFWQYTNKASISGIPGAASMDENRFNGSVADLKVYSDSVVRSLPRPSPTSFKLSTTLGVQQALNFLEVVNPRLDEDGTAGPKTKLAIEAFQRRAGIGVDGIVGPNTIAALQTALQINP